MTPILSLLIFKHDPEVYRQCVQRLAEGASVTSIQKDLKEAWHTIAAIRTREASVIEATRKHLRGLIGVAAQLAVERLIEKLQDDKIPPSVLPIASGIMIDKMRQSEGEATQTIEVKKSITLEDVRNELSELKRDALDRGNIKLIDLGEKVK